MSCKAPRDGPPPLSLQFLQPPTVLARRFESGDLFEHLIETVLYVPPPLRVGSFRIVAGQRGNQLRVEVRRKYAPLRGGIVKPIENQDLLRLDGIPQGCASGRPGNAQMKIHVVGVNGKKKIRIRRFVRASLIEPVQMPAHPNQLLFLRRRSSHGKQPGRLCFERLAKNVMVANVVFVRDLDARSDARPAFYETFAFEPPQRICYGNEAHFEIAGKFAARQWRAQRKVALENLVAQLDVSLRRKAESRLAALLRRSYSWGSRHFTGPETISLNTNFWIRLPSSTSEA